MREIKFGILLVLILFALVSFTSAADLGTVKGSITYDPGYSPHHFYWRLDVTSPFNPILPSSESPFSLWCADVQHTIASGSHTWTAYSSLDLSTYPGPSAQWAQINYIINYPAKDWRITQAAIWHYDGWKPSDGLYPYNGDIQPDTRQSGGYLTGAIAGTTPDSYNKYIRDVESAVENGFTPTCGELYAVILFSYTSSPPNYYQVILVPRPTPKCVPEFPSLALPVGMMLGLGYTVYVIKGRKK